MANLCKSLKINPITLIKRNSSQTTLEDEGILGYAGLMPKINSEDGSIDTNVDTFLTQLKKLEVIQNLTVYFEMTKSYRTIIIGGSLNTTAWATNSKNYPSVSLKL